MVGDRLRQARQAQQLSLAQVAEKAAISIATLSRIETSKQPLEVGLFLVIAHVLGASPQDLIIDVAEATGDRVDPMVMQIATLAPLARTRMWRGLAAQNRAQRAGRRHAVSDLSQRIEEVVAQIELLRDEIESLRTQVKRARPHSSGTRASLRI